MADTRETKGFTFARVDTASRRQQEPGVKTAPGYWEGDEWIPVNWEGKPYPRQPAVQKASPPLDADHDVCDHYYRAGPGDPDRGPTLECIRAGCVRMTLAEYCAQKRFEHAAGLIIRQPVFQGIRSIHVVEHPDDGIPRFMLHEIPPAAAGLVDEE